MDAHLNHGPPVFPIPRFESSIPRSTPGRPRRIEARLTFTEQLGSADFQGPQPELGALRELTPLRLLENQPPHFGFMLTMSISVQVVCALAAGLLSHVCYFVRGEHHITAPTLLKTYIVLAIVIVSFEFKTGGLGLLDAALTTFAVCTSYASSIFASMLVYRLFFHRLRHFPGPLLARSSKLYHAWQVRKSDQYIFLEQLHQKYGDFVRTGPNEITMFTPSAVAEVYGPSSKCVRSAWYDMMQPLVSMILTRSKPAHDARRRVWDPSFSVKALQSYEDRVLSYAQLLDGSLSSFSSEPVNATAWFKYFAFDVMTDIHYGQSLDMLKNGKDHYAIELSHAGVAVMGPLTPVPWLCQLLMSIPGAQKEWQAYQVWAHEELQSRIKRKPEHFDSVSHPLSAAQEQGGVDIEENYKWLFGDFIANIGAGSETILSTMVFLFYHLAAAPTEIAKLRTELEALTSFSDNRELTSMPHLNGVINETLRLHPPIPSGGLRDTPPEGLEIDGTYIPGGVTVLVPAYSLGRSERCFPRPNEFIPERWYSAPELIQDRAGFIPFSTGKYMCIGKNLALMELRIVTALLVSRYDIGFAPGEDGTALFRDMKDAFTAAPGELRLVFRGRGGGE